MRTLIVTCNGKVRFLITNHPDYRFGQLVRQMPVPIEMLGVTSVKSRDIKAQFGLVGESEWFTMTDKLRRFLLQSLD